MSHVRPVSSAPAAGPAAGPASDLNAARTAPAEPARAGSAFRDSLRRVAAGIAADERAMDRAMRSGAHGQLAPEALIALQARVYRHTQELELGSKVVDKAASAVKQTLQSQQ